MQYINYFKGELLWIFQVGQVDAEKQTQQK
jgi:hypothetical protein